MENIEKMGAGRRILVRKLVGGYLEFYNKKISIM